MSQTEDRQPRPGPLHPEDLAELRCWAEDTAVERNWRHTDRMWIRGTVAKLIRNFTALRRELDRQFGHPHHGHADLCQVCGSELGDACRCHQEPNP